MAKATPDPRKERLIDLSNLYRSSLNKKTDEENLCVNCNEFVLKTYTTETSAAVWKTFKQWRKDGYKVVKGAKGFPIWSKPIKAKAGKETQAEPQTDSKTDKKEFSFFGICYLFNNLQVEKI